MRNYEGSSFEQYHHNLRWVWLVIEFDELFFFFFYIGMYKN